MERKGRAAAVEDVKFYLVRPVRTAISRVALSNSLKESAPIGGYKDYIDGYSVERWVTELLALWANGSSVNSETPYSRSWVGINGGGLSKLKVGK